MATRERLWSPALTRLQESQMYRFLLRLSSRYRLDPDWETVRAWAIENRGEFWEEIIELAGVKPSQPALQPVNSEGMLGTRWFPGMRLNYARHMLRFEDSHDAILFESEAGHTANLSHRELRGEVARMAAALRRDRVRIGDRVAGYLPNLPETVVAMLAATSLGAAWSSCSPDFGVGAVLDRFGQIEPTVLVVSDGYTYGGKRFETLDRARELLNKLPSVRRLVVVPYIDSATKPADVVPAGSRCAASTWREYLGPADAPPPPLEFEEVPFDHPLFIMYSSGTTGVPKCIVHGHGGTLLQHMKELMLHCDLRHGDRFFYFTTCGWMMWNWLVSGLGTGAAVVLYDGNPAHPDAHRLWKLAERVKLNIFGASPKFLAACQKADIHPGREHDLSHLRAVLSTGSPLSEELFRWVYEEIHDDLQLSSISGGTDIISCFMLGNPILPVYAGEIQCRGLAMDVQAWDEFGRPVTNQKGELVCCAPFPSQPVGFWNDPDGSKYRRAYFEFEWRAEEGAEGSRGRGAEGQRGQGVEGPRGPGTEGEGAAATAGGAGATASTRPVVWRHGDFIEIADTGGVIVYGRSDATLNPGGVRIGTAEIYRIVEALPEVLDSICVAKKTADEDEQICLFVVLRPGHTLDGPLRDRIREAIAAGATKRHVPRFIAQVTAIPHTISGKKVELAVQQVLNGQEVKNRDALANPEALDQFRTAV